MFSTPTINKYLSKLFFSYLLATASIVLVLLFISNTFDVLHKFKGSDISPITFWQLISYKVPHVFNEVSVLIGFISTVIFLERLSIGKELVILSASSMQNWRIYTIPITITFVFGYVVLLLVSPLGTYSLAEYEKIESLVTNRPESKVVVSQSGIFFYEQFDNSHRIISANSINIAQKELSDLTILIVDSDNNFLQRLDANKVTLDNNNFYLYDPTIVSRDKMSRQDSIILPTKLSVDNLIQRFTAPELIYIWNLRDSIDKFSKSGISTSEYELYYYKQLLKPLIMATMALLACWFVSVNSRDNKHVKTVIYGLITGILAFFFIEISSRFLAISGFNAFFACLLPALVIILLGNFVILHFQEA